MNRRPPTRRRRRPSKRSWRRRLILLGIAGILVTVGGIIAWERLVLNIHELSDRRSVRWLEVPLPDGNTRQLIVGPANPYWTPLNRVSKFAVLCVIKAEDSRYWNHHGLDAIELRRSIELNLREGRFARGGSTLTMQLAKNLFLWRDKSILRKVLETYLAIRLEQTLEKRRILELYLNIVEWGPGIYGIGEASHHYFNKPASAITLNEAALLAGILPNPTDWNPNANSSIARQRQQALLRRLRRENALADL